MSTINKKIQYLEKLQILIRDHLAATLENTITFLRITFMHTKHIDH